MIVTEFRNQMRRIWREPVFWLIPFVLTVLFLIPMQTGNNIYTVQRLRTEAQSIFPNTKLAELTTAAAQDGNKVVRVKRYRKASALLNGAANAGNRVAFAQAAAEMQRLTAKITDSPVATNLVPFQYLSKHHLPVYFAEEQKRIPATVYLAANVTPIANSVILLLVLGATVAYLMLLPHLRHDDELTSVLPRGIGFVLSIQSIAVLFSTFCAYLAGLALSCVLPMVHAGFGSLRYPILVYHETKAFIFTTGQLIGGQILQVGAFLILFVGVSVLIRTLRASLIINMVVLLGTVLLAEAPFVTSATVQPASWLQFFPSTYVWMQTVLTRDRSVSLITALQPVAGGLLVAGYGVIAFCAALVIQSHKLKDHL